MKAENGKALESRFLEGYKSASSLYDVHDDALSTTFTALLNFSAKIDFELDLCERVRRQGHFEFSRQKLIWN